MQILDNLSIDRLKLLSDLLSDIIGDHIQHGLPEKLLEFCADCIAEYFQSKLIGSTPFQLSEEATHQLAFVILNEILLVIAKTDRQHWLTIDVYYAHCLGSSVRKGEFRLGGQKSMSAPYSRSSESRNVHVKSDSSNKDTTMQSIASWILTIPEFSKNQNGELSRTPVEREIVERDQLRTNTRPVEQKRETALLQEADLENHRKLSPLPLQVKGVGSDHTG